LSGSLQAIAHAVEVPVGILAPLVHLADGELQGLDATLQPRDGVGLIDGLLGLRSTVGAELRLSSAVRAGHPLERGGDAEGAAVVGADSDSVAQSGSSRGGDPGGNPACHGVIPYGSGPSEPARKGVGDRGGSGEWNIPQNAEYALFLVGVGSFSDPRAPGRSHASRDGASVVRMRRSASEAGDLGVPGGCDARN
jgi:hypothetical protein